MKFLKLLGRLVLGLFALALLLYLVAVAINWRDEPPSAAALKLAQVIADRPAVPASENAVVYMYGFAAPPGIDPVEMGALRMTWIEKLDAVKDPASPTTGDPLGAADKLDFAGGSRVVARMQSSCGWEDDRKGCAEAFDLAARELRLESTDELALQRYAALLTRHAWRDVAPLDVRAPAPEYVGVLHAQRLYLLRLMQQAAEGKVDAVRAGLSADFAHWRAALLAADHMLGQMIALAAIRNHFFYSQRILRNLTGQQIETAMPADWSRGFTREELSMLRSMAGELAFNIRALRDTRELFDDVGGDSEFPPKPDFIERTSARISEPLFQLQATSNLFAADCLRFVEAFAVPIDQYGKASESLKHADVPMSVYNFTGKHLYRSLEGTGTPYPTYAVRVASAEGWRRAALLIAQLRARGLTADAAAAEVLRSELDEPRTGEPFEWNVQRRSVTVAGPEEFPMYREEYFY